jgi:hypothetical protein
MQLSKAQYGTSIDLRSACAQLLVGKMLLHSYTCRPRPQLVAPNTATYYMLPWACCTMCVLLCASTSFLVSICCETAQEARREGACQLHLSKPLAELYLFGAAALLSNGLDLTAGLKVLCCKPTE